MTTSSPLSNQTKNRLMKAANYQKMTNSTSLIQTHWCESEDPLIQLRGGLHQF